MSDLSEESVLVTLDTLIRIPLEKFQDRDKY